MGRGRDRSKIWAIVGAGVGEWASLEAEAGLKPG